MARGAEYGRGRPAAHLLGLVALAAVCGGCEAGGAFVPAVSVADFDQKVLQADGPVMVEFYRNGCGACAALAGTMTKLSNEYADRVAFVKLERSVHDVRRRYRIVSYPTLILFRDGREARRWTDEFEIQAYRDGLDRALGSK